jgi:hypothetical protein
MRTCRNWHADGCMLSILLDSTAVPKGQTMPGESNRNQSRWGRPRVAQHAMLSSPNENDPVPVGTAANNPG